MYASPKVFSKTLKKSIYALVRNLNREDIQGPEALLQDFIGNSNAVRIFWRLLYWQPKAKKWGDWVYKSWRDWYNELRLSEGQIKRVHQGEFLEKIGIEREIMMANGARTTHYRLNPEKFMQALADFLDVSVEELEQLMNIERKQKPETSESVRQPQQPPEPRPLSPPQSENSSDFIEAVPGEFQGVQMRSQLEIRFAAELEIRRIQWQYEIGRTGTGNYMIDFYLPDLKIWVEVKGVLEARDHFLLKGVAYELSRKRESLFVYQSNRVLMVIADDFFEMTQDKFWQFICTRRDFLHG